MASAPGLTFRYGLAVLSVVAALGLASLLQTFDITVTPHLLAVGVTVWYAGLGPGFLAITLSLVSLDYFFIAPLYDIDISVSHLPELLVFTVLALIVSGLSASRRRAEDALRRTRDELDVKVAERTAELRRSEAQLEQAQRMAHVGYWHRDFETGRITWSDETYRIFGLQPQERALHLDDLQRLVHSDDRQMMRRAITEALDGRARYDLEYRVVRADGEVRVVHSQGDVVRSDSGQPHHMFGTVQDITERKRAEQAMEALAGRLINAQEEERRRIGRELHDHVSQTLGLLLLKIDQLHADPAVPPAIARALTELRETAEAAMADVRRLSHRLHSSMLDYLGLVPALQKLAAEFAAHHGIAIELAHASVPEMLPSDVALSLFRVTEESLTNIAKHSRAHAARVLLSGAVDGLHLTVDDDGDGFDGSRIDSKRGLGFVSMQERLRLLRGTVRIDSSPQQGTTIEVWVPAASLVGSTPSDVAAPAVWTREYYPSRTSV